MASEAAKRAYQFYLSTQVYRGNCPLVYRPALLASFAFVVVRSALSPSSARSLSAAAQPLPAGRRRGRAQFRLKRQEKQPPPRARGPFYLRCPGVLLFVESRSLLGRVTGRIGGCLGGCYIACILESTDFEKLQQIARKQRKRHSKLRRHLPLRGREGRVNCNSFPPTRPRDG